MANAFTSNDEAVAVIDNIDSAKRQKKEKHIVDKVIVCAMMMSAFCDWFNNKLKAAQYLVTV